MGFKGSLDTFNLADVFQNLSLNQQTGTLRITADTGVVKNIYFAEGQIRYLSHGGSKPLLLGEMIAGRGVASQDQVAQALARQADTKKPLGECLVDLGFVTRERIDELIQHQIEEEIYDLFGWEKADFEFVEGGPAPDLFGDQVGYVRETKINISSLIMEAARRIDEWERIREQVPSPREIYVFDPALTKAAGSGELDLDPIEKRVFSLMNGSRDVEDLIDDSYLFRFEVAKALCGFLQHGMVRPAAKEELLVTVRECERQGETRRCIKIYERILAMGVDDIELRQALAEACASEGNTEKAAIHLNVLAETALKDGNEERAVSIFRRIVQLLPRHAPSRERLAAIYARRSQKREAMIHYQELCGIYQETTRPAEAKAVCVKALDLDPTHMDMRNELVKLYLAENDRTSAAKELEVIADLFAKTGKVRQAAEVYRRILTMDRSLPHIKTKLSNVLLSEDEKRHRRIIARTVTAAVVAFLLAAGGIGFLEYRNREKLKDAMDDSSRLQDEASGLEKNEKYAEASAKYRDAAMAMAPVRQAWSPFLRVGKSANDRIAEMDGKATEAERKAGELVEVKQRWIEGLLGEIEQHQRLYEYAQAIDKCRQVALSPYATDAQKTYCADRVDLLNKKVQDVQAFEKDMQENRWASVEQEFERKTWFMRTYPDHEVAKKIQLPLAVLSPTVDSDISLDGAWLGVASAKPLVLRYDPRRKSHVLEARKAGYKSFKRQFDQLEIWEVRVALGREAEWKFSAGEAISAQPGYSEIDRTFFLGTAEGSVIAVQEGKEERLWRIRVPGGLGCDILGKVHYVKTSPTEKGWLWFATQRGEVYAYNLADGVKNATWQTPPAKDGMKAGIAVEEVARLGGARIIFAPEGREVVAYRATRMEKLWTTSRHSAAFTSAPLVVGGNVWVGNEDGALYAFDVGQGTLVRRIPTGQFPVRCRPLHDRGILHVGNDNGQLLALDTDRGSVLNRFEARGAILGEPQLKDGKIYFGTIQSQVFCVDSTNITDRRYAYKIPEGGAIEWPPLVTEKAVYFGTSKGTFYALDRAKGFPLWEYATERERPAVGQPVVVGKRVYFFSADGTVYGFQED